MSEAKAMTLSMRKSKSVRRQDFSDGFFSSNQDESIDQNEMFREENKIHQEMFGFNSQDNNSETRNRKRPKLVPLNEPSSDSYRSCSFSSDSKNKPTP